MVLEVETSSDRIAKCRAVVVLKRMDAFELQSNVVLVSVKKKSYCIRTNLEAVQEERTGIKCKGNFSIFCTVATVDIENEYATCFFVVTCLHSTQMQCAAIASNCHGDT